MSKVVENYYNQTVEIEWSRLDRHPIEFEITKKHIDQFLLPKSRILDVGGGPGKYSFHYAAAGHQVTLFDLSPLNVAFAGKKQEEFGVKFENLIVGNATSMTTVPDKTFDFIFCMGPLYHLTNERDRSKVLMECRRVLKDTGKVLFSFVTHMAQTISVIKRNMTNIGSWEPALVQGIETGINDTEFDTGFTEAYFMRPESIRDFVGKAGFSVLKIAGAEGLACQSEERLMNLDRCSLEKWIDFLFRYSEDESILGANQHVICIAEKRF